MNIFVLLIRKKQESAIYIKHTIVVFFFLSHPTPTMIEGKYIHYKFLRENRFL